MRASIQGKGPGHGRCADLKKQIEAKNQGAEKLFRARGLREEAEAAGVSVARGYVRCRVGDGSRASLCP